MARRAGRGVVTIFAYSIGASRYDARPERREAASLRAFAADVLRRRAPNKAAAGYVAAAFGGDGRRSRANAEPCTWLAIDADAIDAAVWPEWRLYLVRYRGFGWPTASSTPAAPRERCILELSEPVAREERIAIGALLSGDIAAEFGAAVVIDPSTYRAEQPCFLPLTDARPYYLLGEPLDVPRWLAQAPPAPPEPPPASAAVVALADVRMRVVVAQLHAAGLLLAPLPNARGYAMLCPWQRAHTTSAERGTSATALLFPSEENGWRGAFRCLHAHCAQRRLRDLLDVLRRASRASRASQAA